MRTTEKSRKAELPSISRPLLSRPTTQSTHNQQEANELVSAPFCSQLYRQQSTGHFVRSQGFLYPTLRLSLHNV